MDELRLEDLLAFGLTCVVILAAGAAVVLLYYFWPQIAMFFRAIFTRHFNRGWWDDMLVWVADQGVRDYEDGNEAVDKRPTCIMSNRSAGHERFRTGTQGGFEERFYGTRTAPVREDREVTFEDVRTFLLDNNLTDEDAVDLFTLAKRKTGYFLSANKIRDTVGGSDAEVKNQVRKWRGEGVKQAPPSVSPIAGRPIPTAVRFHSDNPELEYQAPD